MTHAPADATAPVVSLRGVRKTYRLASPMANLLWRPQAGSQLKLGLSRAHVTQVPGTFTAQAFITTDLDADADDYAPAGLTLDNDIKCEALVGDIYGLPCEYELRKS